MVSGVILLVTDLPMASIKRIITGVVSSKWPIQKRRKSKFGNISIISKAEATMKDNEIRRCDSESVNVVAVDKKAYEESEINFSVIDMNSEMISPIFGACQILCKCFHHTI